MTKAEQKFLAGIMGMTGEHFCDVTRVAYMLVCRFPNMRTMAGVNRAFQLASDFVSKRTNDPKEIAVEFGRPYFARGGAHEINKREAIILEKHL